MNELIKKLKRARLIFICGNGGSASTAEHFVTDLVKKGYPAICLNSNMSLMTMIANDYGYERVFSKQLEVLGQNKDLLITISCSGTSKNILYARTYANLLGMKMYNFEVFGVESEFGKLEDKHLAFAHAVSKEIEVKE